MAFDPNRVYHHNSFRTNVIAVKVRFLESFFAPYFHARHTLGSIFNLYIQIIGSVLVLTAKLSVPAFRIHGARFCKSDVAQDMVQSMGIGLFFNLGSKFFFRKIEMFIHFCKNESFLDLNTANRIQLKEWQDQKNQIPRSVRFLIYNQSTKNTFTRQFAS